jgi:hypothetical protein
MSLSTTNRRGTHWAARGTHWAARGTHWPVRSLIGAAT